MTKSTAAGKAFPPWPALKRYRGQYLDRVVLPIGGIGTGAVGFAGNGALRDWEIMNTPGKGYIPSFKGELKTPTSSMVLRYAVASRAPGMKVLEGPIPLSGYEAAEGSATPNANLPRFRDAEFATAYPFGEVTLRDPDCPLAVRLQAFNPFIPGDADLSGFPVAFFRCVLTNPTVDSVSASVSFSLPNFIGADGGEFVYNGHNRAQDAVGFKKNRNEWRDAGKLAGIFLKSDGVDPAHTAWGTMSLTTPTGKNISHRTSWADVGWGDMILDYWDDLLADGRLDEREAPHESPMASLCVSRRLQPGATIAIPFLLAWHFPNRIGWAHEGKIGDAPVGNYYAGQFSDAWKVAESFWPRQRILEKRTLDFVDGFLAGDAPEVIKEAALFNLSTIRTQTCFRTADGRFFAWEGIFDRKGYLNPRGTGVWGDETLRVLGTLGIVESFHGGGNTRLVIGETDHGPLDTAAPGIDFLTAYLQSISGHGEMPLSLEQELSPTRWAIRAKQGMKAPNYDRYAVQIRGAARARGRPNPDWRRWVEFRPAHRP